MRGLIALSAFVVLSGCLSFAPLDEEDRTRIRVVAPAAAQFPPTVEFKTPPGTKESAEEGAVGAGGAMAIWWCPIIPQYCLAFVAPAAIVGFGVGAAATPSNEGLAATIEDVRGHLGAPDVQQLLMQRFSQKVTVLTPYEIDLRAATKGPQSSDEAPSYSGMDTAEGTVIAEVAIGFVGATLVDQPVDFFGPDYADRPLRIVVAARMRLIRPSDGAALMTRVYIVGRYGRRIKAYHDNAGLLPKAIAAAVDEVATLMVDDAFLYHSDAARISGLTVTVLEPVPSGACLRTGYDCWAFLRVPTLDTMSPHFRWEPFPATEHLEKAPWLRAGRNFVYDLWVFGGDDDRTVEGLKATEHTLDHPLAPCTRYSWAVRVRFDTDAGPRTIDWSTSSAIHKSGFDPRLINPTFGSPFITPCPSQAESGAGER